MRRIEPTIPDSEGGGRKAQAQALGGCGDGEQLSADSKEPGSSVHKALNSATI